VGGGTRARAADTLDTNAKITVTVAGEPDISGTYTVDSQGNITMLYINEVHVRGLTPEQSRQVIAKKLSAIYRNPQVIVQLISTGGIEVNVTGAVTSPGERTMRSDSHLNDVMQLAAPALDADLSAVEITHGRPGESHPKADVNYAAYLDSQQAYGNPSLRDGDVIFVRHKNGVPIQVNLRGEVAHPGRVSLASKATFVDAIQQAGGLTTDADHKSIVIEHSGSAEQLPVDYDGAFRSPQDQANDPVLLDGDTIVVSTVSRPNIYTITGAVLKPGEYPMPDYPITLADVLGKAGGPADHAKLDKLTVVRLDKAGQIQKLALNATDPVVQKSTTIQSGDNINIPQGAPRQRMDPLQLLGVAVSVIAIGRH
jgi:protein involved in polysaccharide export with SLBB domain